MSRMPAAPTAVADRAVARPVSRPHDAAEREADHAAEVVAAGGQVRDWSLSAAPPTSTGVVQREDGAKDDDKKSAKDPNRKEYEEAAKTTGEALLKTEAGKALKKQVLESPQVKKLKEVATSPAGIAIGATAVAGGVTGLALAGKELPFQPPTIPLDFLRPGLSADVKVTGPLNAPTFVGLTVTFRPKAKDKPKADREAEQAGPRAPQRSSAEEQALSQAAIDDAVRQMTARHPLGTPVMQLDLSPRSTKDSTDEQPVQRAPAGTATDHAGTATDHAGAGTARVDDGFAGAGRPLDEGVRRTMEQHFGQDFSSVRLHDDTRANAAAGRVDARAFTVGEHVVLGQGRDTESPRLLAHELAHVVQNRHGQDDSVHRYTAFSDVDQAGGKSRGWMHPDGSTDLRVADDGRAVVEDNGWGQGTNKRGWSTSQLMAGANADLDAQGSVAQLRERPGGERITGRPPDGGTATSLVEIQPFKPAGGPFNLASDCGTAARQVMGSGPSGKDVATLSRPADPGSKGTGAAVAGGILGALLGGGVGAGIGIGIGSLFGPIGMLVGGLVGGVAGAIGGAIGGAKLGRHLGQRDPAPAREEYLAPRTYHGGNPTTPEEWSEELFQRELGGSTRQEAYANYARLSDAERDAFDRRHGINEYAVPRVGQGLTISTEKDMPGFAVHPGMEDMTWNFHYAATILAAGHDYVTLENAAEWDPFTGWIFYMYGPAKKGQSFHQEQGDTLTHGTEHSTFVVQPEATLDVRTTGTSTTLDTGSSTVSLPTGTPVRIIDRISTGSDERLLVRVTAGDEAGTVGRLDSKDVQ